MPQDIINDLRRMLQKGRTAQVKELVEQALAEGVSPEEILNEGLMGGMNAVGEKFKRNEVFVPEVLVAARALNKGMEALQPALTEADTKPVGTAIIGTVKGDFHDIGKNLVRLMMGARGIEMIDLGVNVEAQAFVDAALQHNAGLICCSSLLDTTMQEMKKVVKAVEAAGLSNKIHVMVGGIPVTQEFAESIGADYYTQDAGSAAELAHRLLTEEK